MKAWQYIERGWTRSHYAVDIDGDDVPASSADAVRWCLIGSLQAAYRDCIEFHEAALRVHAVLEKQFGRHVSLSMWNDHPTRVQADVVAVLKEVDV